MRRVNRGDTMWLQRLSCFERRGILRSAMYPFERFTEAAKKMLTLAQQEAEKSRHAYIGTEHLLLAMTRQPGAIAGDALARLSVTYDAARERVDAVLGRNEGMIIQQIIPTSRVKNVIEMSFAEAQRLDSRVVATDHVLLALAIEGQGVAAHVLADMGATLDVLRETIAAVKEGGVREESSGATRAATFGGPSRTAQTASAIVDVIVSAATAEMVSDAVSDVSMEHVLRALVKMDNDRIKRALESAGIDRTQLIDALTPPDVLVTLRRKLHDASMSKRNAVGREDYPAAEAFRKIEDTLRSEVETAERDWESSRDHGDEPTAG